MYSLFFIAAFGARRKLHHLPRPIDFDATNKRSKRWVLRFNVQGGKDYVQQLKLLGAILAFPEPEGLEVLLIPDLSDPKKRRYATIDDLTELAKKLREGDERKDVVEAIAKELSLQFVPKRFWAFFPRAFEDDLAKKEIRFRNLKPEEISETIFLVTVHDGKPEIKVVEQTAKKRP